MVGNRGVPASSRINETNTESATAISHKKAEISLAQMFWAGVTAVSYTHLALFVAYISTGADVVNRTCDVPIEIINIVQAVIIMFVAAERFLAGWKQRKIVQASQQAQMEKLAGEQTEGAQKA